MKEEFNARKRMWYASHPQEAGQILEGFVKLLKEYLVHYVPRSMDTIRKIDKLLGEKLI